jgi:large subunit ribosomal protein L29
MWKQVARLMKAKEIRDLNASEMDQKVAGLKEELFNLRFQIATGQLENPMRIREVKKAIARIKTIQRETEIKAQRA